MLQVVVDSSNACGVIFVIAAMSPEVNLPVDIEKSGMAPVLANLARLPCASRSLPAVMS